MCGGRQDPQAPLFIVPFGTQQQPLPSVHKSTRNKLFLRVCFLPAAIGFVFLVFFPSIKRASVLGRAKASVFHCPRAPLVLGFVVREPPESEHPVGSFIGFRPSRTHVASCTCTGKKEKSTFQSHSSSSRRAEASSVIFGPCFLSILVLHTDRTCCC